MWAPRATSSRLPVGEQGPRVPTGCDVRGCGGPACHPARRRPLSAPATLAALRAAGVSNLDALRHEKRHGRSSFSEGLGVTGMIAPRLAPAPSFAFTQFLFNPALTGRADVILDIWLSSALETGWTSRRRQLAILTHMGGVHSRKRPSEPLSLRLCSSERVAVPCSAVGARSRVHWRVPRELRLRPGRPLSCPLLLPTDSCPEAASDVLGSKATTHVSCKK